MLNVSLSEQITNNSVGTIVRSLFGAGEPGAWYDPSDLSTMFQDAAGTVPVTGVEQPVGMIRDKSGRGNHATQSTTTSRPVLSARYNLLTYSEQFDNGAWSKINVAINSNVSTAPNGTATASKFVATAVSGYHAVRQVFTYTQGVTYTLTVYAKAAEYTKLLISDLASATMAAQFDLQAVTASLVGAPFFTSVSATITDVGNGWRRCVLTGTANTTATRSPTFCGFPDGASLDANGANYTGDGNSGILIWGAQLIPTNALPSNAYQRVTTATDYDSNPALFPYYLLFDGTDDWLQTGNINFTSTDKMTVVAGVRKLSDADIGGLVELSDSFISNNGSFAFNAPGDAATARYSMGLRGTARAFGGVEPFAAPITNVVVWSLDLAATGVTNEIVSRVNGVNRTLVNTSGNDAGTGTFGNYPLFIGRRAGTAQPFNGRLYGLIVRGAASSAAQIAAVERFMAQKTGVTL